MLSPSVLPQDAGGFTAAVAVSAKDYIGIVDVADLASLILTRGLKRKTPQSLFAKIGDLFAMDDEHSVKSAISLSTTHRFYALPLTGNLAQVGGQLCYHVVMTVIVVDRERMSASQTDVHDFVAIDWR